MPVEGIDVWRVLKGAGVKYVNFVIVDIFGRPRVEKLYCKYLLPELQG